MSLFDDRERAGSDLLLSLDIESHRPRSAPFIEVVSYTRPKAADMDVASMKYTVYRAEIKEFRHRNGGSIRIALNKDMQEVVDLFVNEAIRDLADRLEGR